jgi:hypothetical protein
MERQQQQVGKPVEQGLIEAMAAASMWGYWCMCVCSSYKRGQMQQQQQGILPAKESLLEAEAVAVWLGKPAAAEQVKRVLAVVAVAM